MWVDLEKSSCRILEGVNGSTWPMRDVKMMMIKVTSAVISIRRT